MKLRILVIGSILWMVSSAANSSVIFFTDTFSFDSASSNTLVEDFETFGSKDIALSSFVLNGISYTGHAGLPFPNVWVSSPGYTNYGVPITTSSILTANGDEDITLELSMSATAIGFDTYLNQFGPADVSVFGTSGLLGTYSLLHDPATVGFLGITASEDITSIRWTTTNGGIINTGLDNIRIGSVITVPEPHTAWLMGALLIGGFSRVKLFNRKFR